MQIGLFGKSILVINRMMEGLFGVIGCWLKTKTECETYRDNLIYCIHYNGKAEVMCFFSIPIDKSK